MAMWYACHKPSRLTRNRWDKPSNGGNSHLAVQDLSDKVHRTRGHTEDAWWSIAMAAALRVQVHLISGSLVKIIGLQSMMPHYVSSSLAVYLSPYLWRLWPSWTITMPMSNCCRKYCFHDLLKSVDFLWELQRPELGWNAHEVGLKLNCSRVKVCLFGCHMAVANQSLTSCNCSMQGSLCHG